MKLAAEAKLVDAGISIENDAELILFADATTCALLKEAAIDFFLSNSEAVIASGGYAKVKESPGIMHELVAAMSNGKKKLAAPSGPDDRDYEQMSVSQLRKKLYDKGFDLDGSREALISRLEEADRDAAIDIK